MNVPGHPKGQIEKHQALVILRVPNTQNSKLSVGGGGEAWGLGKSMSGIYLLLCSSLGYDSENSKSTSGPFITLNISLNARLEDTHLNMYLGIKLKLEK